MQEDERDCDNNNHEKKKKKKAECEIMRTKSTTIASLLSIFIFLNFFILNFNRDEKPRFGSQNEFFYSENSYLLDLKDFE